MGGFWGEMILDWTEQPGSGWRVKGALADFAQYIGRLEIDTTESAAMLPVEGKSLAEQLAGSLGVSPGDAAVVEIARERERNLSAFDEYLAEEQAALVEAMVRSY